ncbi:MAG: PfkB family carbohydrate kinase [Bdellovibrionales bacterium]
MSKKVVVFGSCNVDIFFAVSNMDFFTDTSPGAEDALHFSLHMQAPGGKGANQAVAAAKAGAKVYMFGGIGQGAHGRFLIQNFKDHKISTTGLQKMEQPTGLAVIMNKPDGSHKLLVSHGANTVAQSKHVPDSLLTKNSILLFQTETNIKENSKLMKRAKKKGAQIIYNVAPAAALPSADLKMIDFLIVNKPEAEVIAQSQNMDASSLPTFAQLMADKYNLMCIVTLGAKGVIAAQAKHDKLIELPCLSVKVVDTVGAGDAFAGAFAAALADDVDPVTALAHGITGGSLACTRVGAQAALPTAQEIKKHLPSLLKKLKG